MNGIIQFMKKWAVFLIIAVLVGIFLLAGLRLCAVVSGSMEPNIPVWSLCVANTRVRYEDIKTGDVVVYIRRSDGMRIIHRVVEITDSGMVTKGDANKYSDGVSVGPDNLYAKYLCHVPWLGRLPQFFRTPAGYVVLALMLAACIFLTAGGDAKKKPKDGGPDPAETEGSGETPEEGEPPCICTSETTSSSENRRSSESSTSTTPASRR